MLNNTHKVDEDIKREEAGGHRDGGFQYSHPCFGMIRISRQSGGDGRKLFGSEIETNNTIAITISEANVTQDLGRNWYYDHTILTEISMSPVQYAELISNPNTQGSPCTIK